MTATQSTHPMQLPIAPDKPWLAPLAGFSDLPFRLFCREYGAACCVTEMISAKGLIYYSPGTEALLRTTPEDMPLVVQLFGGEPDTVAKGLDMCLKRGFTHFDLNAGCGVRKVVKTGSGAALLKDMDRLVSIAEMMIARAGRGRVSVKFRLGWTKDDEVYLDLGRRLEETGAGFLTLHARYSSQGFSGTADHEKIGLLKEAVSIPVIASGDLFTAEDGVRVIRQTRADTVMFARGALNDPSIFSRYLALLRGEIPPPQNDAVYLLNMINRHAELLRRYEHEEKILMRMRSIIPRYVRCVANARALRKSITSCTSWQELEAMLKETLQAQPPVAEYSEEHHTSV